MRLRFYTMDRELGTAELLDGVTQKDLVDAVRSGRFFFDEILRPDAEPKPAPKASKTATPKAS